jgi:hypothetical protein
MFYRSGFSKHLVEIIKKKDAEGLLGRFPSGAAVSTARAAKAEECFRNMKSAHAKYRPGCRSSFIDDFRACFFPERTPKCRFAFSM